MSTITTIQALDKVGDSRSVINTNFGNLNTDKIETSVLDTDGTLAANSDEKVATQKATKTYADTKQATLVSGTNIKTINGTTLLGSGDIVVSASTVEIWTGLTGTYASTTTFTTTESSSGEATRKARLSERCLLTCTDSGGSTRRIGYIKSATTSTVTVTYTVVTDSNLASGDIAFKIAYNRKVEDYRHLISVPGEIVLDASNPQGVWLLNVKRDSYLLPVNSAVRTAAAGSGAACAWNVYKNTTNLFTSAQDMTTSATYDEKRPDTNTITAGEHISLRITASAGATNKASDFQAELFIVPQNLFLGV